MLGMEKTVSRVQFGACGDRGEQGDIQMEISIEQLDLLREEAEEVKPGCYPRTQRKDFPEGMSSQLGQMLQERTTKLGRKCQMVQPRWKKSMKVPQKLKKERPHDLTAPCLGSYPKELKSGHLQRHPHSHVPWSIIQGSQVTERA